MKQPIDWLNPLQKKLFGFVEKYHGSQKRKYTNDPYTNHLLRVAAKAQKHNIPNGVEIALCHDLLEDTTCSKAQLKLILFEIFKDRTIIDRIFNGVVDLTDVYVKEDFPKMNRAMRKKLETQRLKKINPISQSVKYCDLIDNTQSILPYDPKFGKLYLSEKKEILRVMNKGNFDLYMEACSECYNGLKSLMVRVL
jgi:(p)ppGpp synthase/HD superfamily hydrolase